jgi:hypothetical protein
VRLSLSEKKCKPKLHKFVAVESSKQDLKEIVMHCAQTDVNLQYLKRPYRNICFAKVTCWPDHANDMTWLISLL